MTNKLLGAVAAISFIAAPISAASANPAASLSVAKQVRASTSSSKSNKALGAGAFGLVIAAGVAAIAVVGFTVGDNGDDSDSN